MDAVVENIVRGNQQIPRNPQHTQNRQKPLAKRHDAQIDHADRDVQHVHGSEPEERRRELRYVLRNVSQFSGSCARGLGKSGDGQPFSNQLAPLHSVQHDKRRPEHHRR